MKRLSDQTLYEILEVPEDAQPAAIQAAWQRAHDIYGPGSLATYTLMSPDEAALLARRIEEARATLLDPGARARYDEGLRQPEPRSPAAGGPPLHVRPLPPVIPALVVPPRPAPQAEADDADDADEDAAPDVETPPPPTAREETPLAQPAILLSAALAASEPPVEPPPPPPPAAMPEPQRPILLEREVAAAAAPPPPTARPTEPAPAMAVPLPVVPDGNWTGDALRQVREARGLSVQQIAERTKVTRHHIENIEGERFGALPAQVYLRGILLSLARELRLDGQKVARAYLERVAAAARPK